MTDVRPELLTPDQVTSFRHAIFGNARSLAKDALLLFGHKRFARAYSLAILGSEELFKLFPLWIASTKGAYQTNVFWDQMKNFMTSHKYKLGMLAALEPTLFGAIRGSIDSPPVSTRQDIQDLIDEAQKTNLLKQDGFYVAFDGAQFKIPGENITRTLAMEAIERLGQRLLLCTYVDALLWATREGKDVLEALEAAREVMWKDLEE